MRTIVYLIDMNDNNGSDLELAVNEIIERIPCFVDEKGIFYNEVDCLELTITCRENDIAFVEMMLAPFVWTALVFVKLLLYNTYIDIII